MAESTNMRRPADRDIEEGLINGHVRDIERRITPIDATLEKRSDEGNENENVVDTNKLANSLETMLENVPRYMCSPGHPGRLSKIPENIREVDRISYEPCYLSIGPYHHGRPSLQCMERTKWVVLKCFLEQRPEIKLKDVLSEMKSLERMARSFYTDVEMESQQFVQMLLLDSLYLVIVFCGMTKSREGSQAHTRNWSSIDNADKDDWVNQINEGIGSMNDDKDILTIKSTEQSSKPRWCWTLLVRDLFLLENQLPFFVLEKMHDLVYGGSETPLIVTITGIFQDLLLDYVILDSEKVIPPSEEVHHLLHLCHLFFRPTIQQETIPLTTFELPESNQMFRLGSVVQLYEAGVRFEPKTSSTQHSLLDITFNRSGKMAMPCLHVDDNTNSLLRNLIALEQMKYPKLGLNVSAYAVFLLHLITIPADVKLLRRKGIIQHHLASDKEMMYLINRLSVGLAFDYVEDEYSLKPIFQELKRYSNNRVPRWRAWLKHRYFKNPWTMISLLAASLLLLLSAVQTFYAVYSYSHPYFDGHS